MKTLDKYTEKKDKSLLLEASNKFFNDWVEKSNSTLYENLNKESKRLNDLLEKLTYIGLQSSETYKKTVIESLKIESDIKKYESFSYCYAMIDKLDSITEGRALFLPNEFLAENNIHVNNAKTLDSFSGIISEEVVERLYTVKQKIESNLSNNGFEYLNNSFNERNFGRLTMFFTVAAGIGMLIFQYFPLGIIVYEVF